MQKFTYLVLILGNFGYKIKKNLHISKIIYNFAN